MRLLKTGPYVPGDEKLEVIQKWGKDIPAYAILSHTWSTNPDDEVLLKDVENGTCSTKPAFAKLENAMQRAMLDGWGWLWIDTVCIDKTSSVELIEAINSMYEYYKKSQKCYAFLSDVEGTEVNASFNSSRWFKRGWTLQELLAPKEVQFLNGEWQSLGYRDSLHETISKITGIEYGYLTGSLPVEHASIAKRMSWAATRETTREEDIAYSMIGLFDVNMPMLYGEGATKAFLRLQEEIIKANEDQSIFAWVKPTDSDHRFHGLLADSPKDFMYTGNTISYTETQLKNYKPTMMTARGLYVELQLTPKNNDRVIAAIHCPVPGQSNTGWLAVYLTRLNTGRGQYARVDCDKLASVVEQGSPEEIYVKQKFTDFQVQEVYPNHYFVLRSLASSSDYPDFGEYKIVRFAGRTLRTNSNLVQRQNAPTAEPKPWSTVPMVYTIDKTKGSLTTALLLRRELDGEEFVILLGAISDFDVGVSISDFTACLAPGIQFPEIQQLFRPQPPGKYVELEYHTVRVSTQEFVKNNQKTYYVDIDIKAYPRAPTTTELLEGAIGSLVPGQGRATARTEFKDKAKRRFWQSR